ncbi:hypothetical protein PAMP_009406 [Pampus punctatissimus]
MTDGEGRARFQYAECPEGQEQEEVLEEVRLAIPTAYQNDAPGHDVDPGRGCDQEEEEKEVERRRMGSSGRREEGEAEWIPDVQERVEQEPELEVEVGPTLGARIMAPILKFPMHYSPFSLLTVQLARGESYMQTCATSVIHTAARRFLSPDSDELHREGWCPDTIRQSKQRDLKTAGSLVLFRSVVQHVSLLCLKSGAAYSGRSKRVSAHTRSVKNKSSSNPVLRQSD